MLALLLSSFKLKNTEEKLVTLLNASSEASRMPPTVEEVLSTVNQHPDLKVDLDILLEREAGSLAAK